MFGLNKRLVFSLYLSGRKSSLEVLKIEKAKKGEKAKGAEGTSFRSKLF